MPLPRSPHVGQLLRANWRPGLASKKCKQAIHRAAPHVDVCRVPCVPTAMESADHICPLLSKLIGLPLTLGMRTHLAH